jgi:WD40 repeat protein
MRHLFQFLRPLVGPWGIFAAVLLAAIPASASPPPVVEAPPSSLTRESEEPGDLGITCSELSPERLEQLKVGQGVVIDTLFQNRAGHRAGLKRDDVIQRLDGREILNPNDLAAALLARHAGESIRLDLVREGRPFILSVTLGTAPLRLLLTLAGHQNTVNAIAFAPDGRTLASGGADRTIRIWDAATGQLLRTLEGHTEEVRTVAFSPDGRTLASCGGELKLWDAATGALRRTLKWGVPVYAAAFSPDGKTLATGSADHTARLWDPDTGLLVRSLKEHRCSRVTWVAFSPDGHTLASVGSRGSVDEDTPMEDQPDAELQLWEPQTGALKRPLAGPGGPWTSLAFSPDGKIVVGGTTASDEPKDEGPICLWDAQTGARKRSLLLPGASVEAVAFSPDGRLIASGDYSRDDEATAAGLAVWDAATGQLKLRLKIDRGFLTAVTFSPDGQLLATGGSARTIKLWRLRP